MSPFGNGRTPQGEMSFFHEGLGDLVGALVFASIIARVFWPFVVFKQPGLCSLWTEIFCQYSWD